VKNPVRRFAAFSAFATCCFLNTWTELANQPDLYFRRYAPLGTVVIPALCCELIVVLAAYAGWSLYRRFGRHRPDLWRGAALLACVWPAGISAVAIVLLIPERWIVPFVRNFWFWPAVAMFGGLALWLVRKKLRRLPHAAQQVLLYSWPMLAVIYFQSLRAIAMQPAEAFLDRPLAPRFAASRPAVRVVWIIWDELDQGVLFDQRPPRLDLPAFDRLRRESFSADKAASPATNTRLSIPSLILGRTIKTAVPSGSSELLVDGQGQSSGSNMRWSELDNVFTDVRSLSGNTAAVGWYHPYSRVLARSLTSSEWIADRMPAGTEEPDQPESLLRLIAARASYTMGTVPLLDRLPFVNPEVTQRQQRIRQLETLKQAGERFAIDPSLALVLLHFPVPHIPGIYSRAEGRLSPATSGNYFDNLALADRLMGELRQLMESAGEWDRTAVLVTADHGWRRRLWKSSLLWTREEDTSFAQLRDTRENHVPFVLKLPGEHGTYQFHQGFNTVLTRRLLVSILRGEVQTPEQAAAWIASEIPKAEKP
jgi:hypothetical protein